MEGPSKPYSGRPDRAAASVRAKGVAARAAGLGPDTCPYRDIRKADGRLTFGRYWRNLWFEGYNA